MPLRAESSPCIRMRAAGVSGRILTSGATANPASQRQTLYRINAELAFAGTSSPGLETSKDPRRKTILAIRRRQIRAKICGQYGPDHFGSKSMLLAATLARTVQQLFA